MAFSGCPRGPRVGCETTCPRHIVPNFSAETAGGLVFTGRNDGRLTALNSLTGKRLWEFQTGAGLNAPVSIFEYEGEQYVVAYSAGSLFAARPVETACGCSR
jgi:glucose dehydrogenase